jgi:hypothetical protein
MEKNALKKNEVIDSLISAFKELQKNLPEDDEPISMSSVIEYLPPVDQVDFGIWMKGILTKLEQLKLIHLDENSLRRFDYYKDQIGELKVSDLFTTNREGITIAPQGHINAIVPKAFYSIVSCITLFQVISADLDALLSWENIENTELIPKRLKQRLNEVQSRLKSFEKDTQNLKEKIDAINNAYDAAEGLPTTLADLEEATSQINSLKEQVKLDAASVQKIKETMLTEERWISETKGQIDALQKEAKNALDMSVNAGLASAFEKKAKGLSWSVWIFSVLLILVLGGATGLSYIRYSSLVSLIEKGALDITQFSMLFVMSLVGLGAFVWAAWIFTKQIYERFRLAQDYAFKASLARSYTAYREQAKELKDPLIEARLFNIAVSRLDELPLRLVDPNIKNSPFEDMLSRPDVQEKMERDPRFKEKILDILKTFLGKSKPEKPHTLTPEALVKKEEE